MKFRHKKRGTEYVLDDIINYMQIAAEGSDIVIERDGETEYFEFQCSSGLFASGLIVLYYGYKDGHLWARPATEFFDGRFERVGRTDAE